MAKDIIKYSKCREINQNAEKVAEKFRKSKVLAEKYSECQKIPTKKNLNHWFFRGVIFNIKSNPVCHLSKIEDE